ncbi:rna-directed dna polymerase from mobile element jockey- hypothetical protein [Limosa lapponica baueri]|uniref:Rna-directed dna polymerase from mobile element jockey-like n=1 Tax=Limosa lapponica baueri TaxID=1758121 RepID=A0A2I0U1S1_LIMLA|nr:rna-directed dna polymerase from mobile element jockey- hypothetical protein [Limosa lapponica baueri]
MELRLQALTLAVLLQKFHISKQVKFPGKMFSHLEFRASNKVDVCLSLYDCLDDGAECTLNKFAGDIKLGGVANTADGRAAIQRECNRLEKWDDRNLMKFNKEKRKVLHLGRKNPMHQYMLGAAQLESSLAEKDPGVLMDTKLNISQCVPLLLRRLMISWAALDKNFQQVEGRDPSPLLSPGEVTPGNLILGFPIQKRHGYTEESPTKAHKGDQGTGESLL